MDTRLARQRSSETVEENFDDIELFFLPPYSPELNPNELAWSHLKTRITKATVTAKEKLQLTIDIALHHLQKITGNHRKFLSSPLM